VGVNMIISKIQAQNYRLLKNTSIDLEKNLSLIVGKNNCGKTSLLSLLNKFIGDKSESNNFTYDDFNVGFKMILFKAVEEGGIKWQEVIPNGIQMLIYIDYDATDDLSNISQFMLDLDPENKTIVLKFEYSLSQDLISEIKNKFSDYKKEHSADETDPEKLFNLFMKSKHKNYFSVIKKSILYDHIKKQLDESVYIDLEKKVAELNKVLSFHYIDARRNVTNAESDHTLSGLSSRYYEKTEGKNKESVAITEFENAIVKTDVSLTDIYDEIFKNVINKVKKFGGQKENDTIVRIVSSISQQQLLKGNTTVVYEDNNHMLPESYNGLGYLNLISMIFEIETLLSDFRKDNKPEQKPSDINILFIEEPEAHTHPQMQYIFINNIKEILRTGSDGSENKNKVSLQTLITTHSSHIVAESNFDDIKYFEKIDVLSEKERQIKILDINFKKDTDIIESELAGEIKISKLKELTEIYDRKIFLLNCAIGTEVRSKNLKKLEIAYRKEKEIIDKETGTDSNHYKFLKQYLTLDRAEIFFADKVILIEGDTERILMPAMMKKIDQEDSSGTPLLSQNISIIEVGAYSQIFDQFIKFIGIKALIITDIDSAIKEHVLDKNGEKKINEGGEFIYKFDKSEVSVATHTTNGAIKHYYSNELKKIKCTQIEYLLGIKDIDKVLKSTDKGWCPDKNGSLMLVYQIKEENSHGDIYNARSFEDAFFHINRDMIIKHKDSFNSLQLKNLLDEIDAKTSKFIHNSYHLANQCVIKKPTFAMDILLNSSYEDNKNYSNWEIPKYIKDGLLWLKMD
jgi:predicted ATP-dependent endonuclease of OLD family